MLYLGVALWTVRAILPAPAHTVPYPAALNGTTGMWIYFGDEKYVLAAIARNAQSVVAGRWRLFDNGFCHPMPKPVTLGEHMFGEGLLAAVPYALTRDPILTYNMVLVLSLLLVALAMYALVLHWTADPGAAFVAGLLFGFHPVRVGDPAHPFCSAIHWGPVALLFAHRLFVRRGWLDVVGLTVAVGLQLLESLYTLVAFAIVGGFYGLALCARHLRGVPSLIPKLLAFGAAIWAVGRTVLGPYLQTRVTWGTLGGRSPILLDLSDFAPGHAAYPGSLALGLAFVALLDRFGRPRPARSDPRLVVLCAGLACLWAAVRQVPLPGMEIAIPGLWGPLSRVIPGLDAIRAANQVRIGTYLASAFLAGYGAHVLTAAQRPWRGPPVTALIAGLAFCEVFCPPIARFTYGHDTAMDVLDVRPSQTTVSFYEREPEGAVLDLPFSLRPAGLIRDMPQYLLLAAFHGRPLAACYNSFLSPLEQDIAALAGRLPERGAVEALHALGFRTVVIHNAALDAKLRRAITDSAHSVEYAGTADGRSFYGLRSATPIHEDLAVLSVSGRPGDPLVLRSGDCLDVVFQNGTNGVFRHPAPIQPSPLLVRWQGASGEIVRTERIQGLLPLALAPGEYQTRALAVSLPAAGEYHVTVAPAGIPRLLIAERDVRVTSSRPDAPSRIGCAPR